MAKFRSNAQNTTACSKLFAELQIEGGGNLDHPEDNKKYMTNVEASADATISLQNRRGSILGRTTSLINSL